jgi:hypothetical protein
MRPIMNIAMCVIVAAALAAPVPTPASPASADYYLKLGDIKGEAAGRSGAGTRIDILSWSWGATSNAKFGAIGGAHRDEGLNAADKRQHGWMPVAQPLDRGSVRIKVKVPWLDCKVGAAYPNAMLQNDAGRYEFQEVMVSSCPTAPSAGGGAASADEVTLNYAKVIVRGWDPAKKEE